jgi:hypothetical protein
MFDNNSTDGGSKHNPLNNRHALHVLFDLIVMFRMLHSFLLPIAISELANLAIQLDHALAKIDPLEVHLLTR